MFFWKILRNRLRKRALLVSWCLVSIIKTDVLKLKEEEVVLVHNKIQQTSDVLTLTAESAEISANEHEVI